METMTWNRYVELAYRTAKQLPHEMQLMHARMGVTTEIGELIDAYKRHKIYGKSLDKVNVSEEVGDACWYIALECKVNGLDIAPIMSMMKAEESLDVVLASLGKLSGRFWEQPSAQMSASLVFVLMMLCALEGIDFEQCLRLNIAKLAERYGDKYSDEAALVRDLITERKTLEATPQD